MHAPRALRQAFTDPLWSFELKIDGWRLMAAVDAGEVQLRTKGGARAEAWFPETAQALASLPGGPHVLDGEIAVMRPDGTSDFDRLLQRARRKHKGRTPPVTYCVFDLLIHNGRDVMGLPLVRRKALLEKLVADRPGILFLRDLPADANLFLSMTLPADQGGLGLRIEGVMAKRRASTYQPGVRSPDWLKIKRPGWQEGRTTWQAGSAKRPR